MAPCSQVCVLAKAAGLFSLVSLKWGDVEIWGAKGYAPHIHVNNLLIATTLISQVHAVLFYKRKSLVTDVNEL